MRTTNEKYAATKQQKKMHHDTKNSWRVKDKEYAPQTENHLNEEINRNVNEYCQIKVLLQTITQTKLTIEHFIVFNRAFYISSATRRFNARLRKKK